MNQPQPSLQIGQIISGALIVSVVAFAAFAVFSRSAHDRDDGKRPADRAPEHGPEDGPSDGLAVLTLMAGAMIGASLLARPFVLGKQDQTAAKLFRGVDGDVIDVPEIRLLGLFQTRTITAMAMLEAPAFLAGIAHMTEGRWEPLAMIGFLVVVMLATFPTESKFQAWVETCRDQSPSIQGN